MLMLIIAFLVTWVVEAEEFRYGGRNVDPYDTDDPPLLRNRSSPESLPLYQIAHQAIASQYILPIWSPGN
jgi:hypothetical protein